VIADELRERLTDKAQKRVVGDLPNGLRIAVVLLDDGGCGVAYTFPDEADEACSVLQQAATISGQSADRG
jgi:hypothetical protein